MQDNVFRVFSDAIEVMMGQQLMAVTIPGVLSGTWGLSLRRQNSWWLDHYSRLWWSHSWWCWVWEGKESAYSWGSLRFMTFDAHLWEAVSKAVKSLGIVLRAGKLFDCPRVLKSCFNAYALSSLEYCAPLWMSSAESNLGLLDSTVCSAKKLCEGELCFLGPDGPPKKGQCLAFAL